jgi:uncharacterized protein YlxP (DUF503 family)
MATVVGLCTIELQIAASASLKDKRRVIRSLQKRVRNEFNVSVAEVDHQDSWQLTTLAVACVATDSGYAHGLMERVVGFIQRIRPDVVLLDYVTELL